MREMKFKMENNYEYIVPGYEVDVEESYLQAGLVVYYTIIPAIAMSGNFKRQEALKNLHGVVSEVVASEGGAYYVTVKFDE
ncbi:MAG: hypothetical protein K6F99_10100 [Lachnospiraceae bacterium]|nr:hypothetical protein [Lachnospiraceae bacterium]